MGEKKILNGTAKIVFLRLEIKTDMKKLSIIGLVVFLAVALCSCKDESGEFVEQLYTNAQKEAAIRDCLKASADTATAHLFVTDGFYGKAAYRIDFSPVLFSLFDTLDNHGYSALCDSLILQTNRMAESCGSPVKSVLKSAIDSLSITGYDALLGGGDDAVTRYFELYKYRSLRSALLSPISIRMGLSNVNATWNEMVQKYMQYSSVPLNFDIQNYIVEKVLDAVLAEMKAEEYLIRTDPDHRIASMDLFEDY